jgi:hypothetical protein
MALPLGKSGEVLGRSGVGVDWEAPGTVRLKAGFRSVQRVIEQCRYAGKACNTVLYLICDQENPTPIPIENQAMRRPYWPPPLGNP